jgi:septal ring factor EnvC (AmiA/AmiB activator)
MLAAPLLLAAALAAGDPPAASPAAATGTEARLKKVQERRQALEREIEALRGQEKSLLGDVERLELQVRLRTQELREIQLALRHTREEMDTAQKHADELERSLAATRPAVIARARALYKLGEFSYARMLLSIDRPVDVLRAYRFISTLAREDRTRVAHFRRDLTALSETRAELAKKDQEMQAQKAEAERRRKRLDGERKEKTALLTTIVEKKEVHLAFAEELSQAEGKLGEILNGSGGEDVAVPIAALRGSLPWPVEGKVRVGFGPRRNPRFDTITAHNGIEIEAAAESPVHAVHEGTVAYAGHFLGYGLMVVIDHGHKHHTLYAHLADVAVALHDHVTAGQVLGTLAAEEPTNLYFELRFQGKPVDPDDWLSRPEKR